MRTAWATYCLKHTWAHTYTQELAQLPSEQRDAGSPKPEDLASKQASKQASLEPSPLSGIRIGTCDSVHEVVMIQQAQAHWHGCRQAQAVTRRHGQAQVGTGKHENRYPAS